MIMTAVDMVNRKGNDLDDHTIRPSWKAISAAAPAITTSSNPSQPARRQWERGRHTHKA
jgi:hypothetical protein